MARVYIDENGDEIVALEGACDIKNVRWIMDNYKDKDAIAKYNKDFFGEVV
jgi:hypothetical protein